ncbi:hypothetical protein ACU4GR_08385 (plasmid) [Methylobacterium oryzae CBMB20]
MDGSIRPRWSTSTPGVGRRRVFPFTVLLRQQSGATGGAGLGAPAGAALTSPKIAE